MINNDAGKIIQFYFMSQVRRSRLDTLYNWTACFIAHDQLCSKLLREFRNNPTSAQQNPQTGIIRERNVGDALVTT